jgi:uncharacterized protein YbaA (DUF1428 family)
MSYVDGYVLPVPTESLAEYRKMARKAGKIWKEHGALAYMECAADDVSEGKRTSFPRSVKLKAHETVVLSYIVFESKRERNRINKLVMDDPRVKDMMSASVVDMKRMFFGGFKGIVEL